MRDDVIVGSLNAGVTSDDIDISGLDASELDRFLAEALDPRVPVAARALDRLTVLTTTSAQPHEDPDPGGARPTRRAAP